tara:strand:+ start:27 stop:248 length:222 start_codon:yes stop_codon:yes gene_type:complete
MSKKQVEINIAVHNIVSFIKETVKKNLYEGSRSGMFELDDNQLKRVCNLVDSSIDQGFTKSHIELESVTKNLK